MLRLFPITGFLGTGATFEADLNLVVQITMGAALIAGARLAKQKRYTAHGICQTTVLLLNLVMIGLVMWPSFQQQVRPALVPLRFVPARGFLQPSAKVFQRWYYAVAAIHVFLGVTAELLGLYIVMVAGTDVLPQWLRFTDWKRWMRAELMLWSVVVLTGVGTYCAWYIAPFR